MSSGRSQFPWLSSFDTDIFSLPFLPLTFFGDFVLDAARRYGVEGVMDRHTTSRPNPRKEHRLRSVRLQRSGA